MARVESHTGEMKTREVPPLVMPDVGPIVREHEDIVLPEPQTSKEVFDALAFFEEPVTIRLERSSEKYAPTLVDVYVNGIAKWIPVGRPFTVARKYVEVLARAQPHSVQTEVEQREGEDPIQRITRSVHAKHPFSVLRDDNPRGFDWLTKLMMSA